MARQTLAEALGNTSNQQRDENGQLLQTKSLSQLAGQVGIAPPVTAVGAGLLGANPDQQKMAGTPAQKTNALSLAQSVGGTGQTLQEAQRSRGGAGGGQLTQAEQQSQDKSKQLGSGLSTLDDRVQSLIHGAFQQTAPAQLQYGVADTIADLAGLPPDKVARFKQQLQAWIDNPTDMGLLNAASNTIGKEIKPEQVNQYLAQADTVVGKAGASAVMDANQFNVGYLLDNQAFQIPETQLTQLLGVDSNTLRGMSLQDLQGKIQQTQQAEFGNIQKLQNMLSDPSVSTAERAAARDQLKTYGETGFRSSGEQMADLQDSIKRSEMVQFGGNNYSVDTLLDDANINKMIATYIRAPDTDPAKKQLQASEPEFTKWLDANKGAFDQALSAQGQFQTGLKTYGGIQDYNRNLAKIGGAQLNPEVAAKLMPGYDPAKVGLSATKLDTSKFAPIYSIMAQDPNGGLIATRLNGLNNTPGGPGVIQELAGLSHNEVQNLAIGGANTKLEKYVQTLADKNALKNASTPQDIIALTLGDEYRNQTPDQISDDIANEKAYDALGLDSNYKELSQYLGADGKLDPEKLRNNKLAKYDQLNLKSLAQDNSPSTVPAIMNESLKLSPGTNKDKQVFQILGNAAKDGEVTADEAQAANIDKFVDDIDTEAPYYKQHGDIAAILEKRGTAGRIQKYLPSLIPGTDSANSVADVKAILDDRVKTIDSDYTTPEERNNVRADWASVKAQIDKMIQDHPGTDLANDFNDIRKSLVDYQTALDARVGKDNTKAAEDTAQGASGLAPDGGAESSGGDGGGSAPDSSPSGDRGALSLSDLQKALQQSGTVIDTLMHPDKWPAAIAGNTRDSLEKIVQGVNAFQQGVTSTLDIPADAYQRLAKGLGIEGGNLKDLISRNVRPPTAATVLPGLAIDMDAGIKAWDDAQKAADKDWTDLQAAAARGEQWARDRIAAATGAAKQTGGNVATFAKKLFG